MSREYTGTIDRWFMFCQVGQISAANAFAAIWDFDTSGDETFNNGVNLSPDGQEPITHIGVSTVCDAEMMSNIENAVVQGTPWLAGYKKSSGFTFESALIDAGLKVVVSE